MFIKRIKKFLFLLFLPIIFSCYFSVAMEEQQKTMIVGGRYTQDCYKEKKEDQSIFLVDVGEPCDLKHDIQKPFQKEYHNRFDKVIFEQLPGFVINNKSIQNALQVLKPGGEIIMNYPFPLTMINRSSGYGDFKNKEITIEVDNKNFTFYHFDSGTSALMIHNDNLKKDDMRPFLEDKLEGVNLEKIYEIVTAKIFNLNTFRVEPWNENMHHGKYWFKKVSPNPKFLLIIRK